MTLVLDRLQLARDGETHLGTVSARFERSQLTAVIGRTLAGKTTLMRAIAGLQGADGGTIALDGRPLAGVPAWKRDVAMVYQQFINYPHLSVFENVAFPLRKARRPDAEVKQRATQALQTVGLDGFAERRPAALSGGQQQRVALARALVRRAGILLLDEPLVNLDYKLREQLREEFRGLLASQTDAIVVYNTTEPAEAMMLGDRLVVMHEGRVLQTGSPADVFERPASTLVAGIVNDPAMNVFSGDLGADSIRLGQDVRLPIPAHLAGVAPGRYRFGIRANEIEPRDDGVLQGRAVFSEVSGSETFIHFETAVGEMVLLLEGVHRVTNGESIAVAVRGDSLFCFEKAGDGSLVAAPRGGGLA